MKLTLQDLQVKNACEKAVEIYQEYVLEHGELTIAEAMLKSVEYLNGSADWAIWLAVEFNQPLPEGFTCEEFYSGERFNQSLPEGFKCEVFSAGESFNQPLPKGFKCERFYAGKSFNQPLPEGFKCKEFYAGGSFNHPLPVMGE